MKYKLINTPNDNYNAQVQVLTNRGLKEDEIQHYMNLTEKDLNDPEIFGEQLLQNAASTIKRHLDAGSDICDIIDCDDDGFTSSAILINYLYDICPSSTIDHVHYFLHEGKQHGLADAMDWIENIMPSLVIIPDAGSNDIEEIAKLHELGIEVIILDHHELEVEPSPYCYLINSQSKEYPNKELSGAGVVYQFCRYMDKFLGVNYADYYKDLAALGLIGDMMSLRSFETRYIISEGLKPENIHNPFIFEMWQKNMFKLTDTPTAWGFTFYVVPFVNAINRSGTQEEKELIFNSMLKFKAFEQILSNKRGHKVGETERLVDQAVRTCTNVKNRQTREEEKGIELVEHLIKDNNMMDHKVLLFLLEPGQIKAEIRGLVANKIMARYQRPCCMLTKRIKILEKPEFEYSKTAVFPILHCPGEEIVTYEGSARGCDKVGVTDFKDICAATGVCDYTVGHQGAFGLGITAGRNNEYEGEVFGENIYQFLDKTDEILKDMPNEPIYYVDYIWDYKDADAKKILEIADLAPYIGKDIDEPLVAIRGIQITKDMLTMMASNTLKITLPNGVPIIKFRMPDEEYEKLISKTGYVEIDAICRCNKNEWNGNISAQLLMDDYEIKGGCAYIF